MITCIYLYYLLSWSTKGFEASYTNCVHELSSGKHRISFENYIDFDDPSYPHYAEELKVFEMLENSITLGVPQSVSKSWDELANLAIKKEADILIMGNDDLIFNTQDWDELLVLETQKVSR